MKSALSIGISVLCVLAATVPVAAAPIEKVLHRFAGGADGCTPYAGIMRNVDGSFYGTTLSCGTANFGTIFRLTPPAAGQTAWGYDVLHDFTGGSDGKMPTAGLVADAAGNLYGTTEQGGANSYGTIFRLKRPASGQTAWTFQTLHAFVPATQGRSVLGTLLIDDLGRLYGAANQNGPGNGGTIFRLNPPASGQTVWGFKVLHSFNFTNCALGCLPWGRLARDADGRLYGTTQGGGTHSNGLVYRLAPNTGKATWSLKVLHSFQDTADGHWPAGVVRDASGNLYGMSTTNDGWNHVVYRLAPPVGASTAWTRSVLRTFAGGNPNVRQTMVLGGGGALYGTVPQAGGDGYGVLFRLTPPASGTGAWPSKVLHTFTGIDTGDGRTPAGDLAIDPGGRIYGITQQGGTGAAGTNGNGIAWFVRP